ncbi:MAG: excinuclease ABC subunit UvrB, partial [Planctomycetota bacterium]|nr:excinuclease ABC subunit UvrB [Planctomycetota bacterium]
SEFRELFPHNAVEYFVSYYDYYQPEAYVPSTDTFIEKDASRNENIERLRNSATRSLLERRDVILVASVSCIYGLGSPSNYQEMAVEVRRGQRIERDDLLRTLTQLQYARNNLDFRRGTFRVRGDVVEVFPAYEADEVLRLEFFGDELECLLRVNPLRGEVLGEYETITIYPANHYVAPQDRVQRSLTTIAAELKERLEVLTEQRRPLEYQRLDQRVRHDLEMLRATGVCGGIENYSRHLDGRKPGEPPFTLLHYFPEDWLLVVDESHVAVPQVGAMYKGDRSRKETLVEHGFRLPSALDNRPLRFEEWEGLVNQIIHVSATPGPYELEQSGAALVEQVVRPTGLLDPPMEVRPATTQVDDLLEECRRVTADGWRVLVTTLTKRSAEELTSYFEDVGLAVRYLHSDIDTMERSAILRDLRLGEFSVLVGINLLREGLDLPEVALVAVLDADKEGFLRSTTSLIQTSGRAARNAQGRVLLYADRVTRSMAAAMDEVKRRRAIQVAYNERHGITPRTVIKPVRDSIEAIYEMDYVELDGRSEASAVKEEASWDGERLRGEAQKVRADMLRAAEELRFEEAAQLRDRLEQLEELALAR